MARISKEERRKRRRERRERIKKAEKKGKKMEVTKEIIPTAFCVRCKKKQTMVNAKPGKMKNGMKVLKGQCSKCGCKMCKIVGKA